MILTSWADVLYISEEFDTENSKFQCTMIAAIDSDDALYYGELPLRRAEISLQRIALALAPIRDSDIFPRWPPATRPNNPELTLTLAAATPTSTVFIKRPNLTQYDVFKGHNVVHLLAQELLDEAWTMEFLSAHPHPHIIRYHGCCSRRGYVTGIVLDRYSTTLEDYVKHKAGPVNVDVFMSALESAVQHLHSLGWAHNDLHPANVLVDLSGAKDALPILIDFGSAKEIGELLGMSRGTTGWIEGRIEDYTVSKRENDNFALKKIRAWMDSATSSDDGKG